MEIESYKQAAAYINEHFTYPKMREFIFGLEEVSFRDIKGIGSINKVLTAEFLLIYFKWGRLDRMGLRNFKSDHFDRASAVLKDLYKGQRFGLDTMIYVLSEGKKDIDERGEESFFYPLMDVSGPCEFGRIYSLIDEWMNDLQTSELYTEKILYHFASVIKMSKALTYTDATTTNELGVMKTFFKIGEDIIDTKDIVYIDKMGNRFVLLDIGYEKEDALFHYMTIDDFNLVTVIKKANRR